MAKKPGFMIYTEWEESLMQLSGPALKELLGAMFCHAKTGEVPPLKNAQAKFAWKVFRSRMDYDTERYEKAVEQRRNAANTRWERERKKGRGQANTQRQKEAPIDDGMEQYMNW